MFEYNGYMCGSNSEKSIKVTEVKTLNDMIMLLSFSNGETRLFDATVLEGPVFEPLKDEVIFRNVCVDHGVVTWANGDIDCAPEYMYAHSYEYVRIA